MYLFTDQNKNNPPLGYVSLGKENVLPSTSSNVQPNLASGNEFSFPNSEQHKKEHKRKQPCATITSNVLAIHNGTFHYTFKHSKNKDPFLFLSIFNSFF